MKKLVALMLVCMLSFPVVSAADKDSPNEGALEKVEASANDTAKKSDANAKAKDENEKKQEQITTNEDGVFKNVIHQRFKAKTERRLQ